MAAGTVDVLRTLPPRPLRLDEQELVVEWLAAAGDVALAYVSERRTDDPAIYRRIVIIKDADSGPTYLIHCQIAWNRDPHFAPNRDPFDS
jgi:hypothetical protein